MIRLFGVLFFIALTSAQTNPIGRWRSMETSKGGIGAMFEFLDDGSFRFSPGAVVEMKYRIEGNQLILPPGTIDGPEQRQTMKWVNMDRLLLESLALSRQGVVQDVKNPILGEWTAPLEMSGVKVEARYLFAPESRALLLMPFVWKKGEYSIKESTIRLQFPGAPPVEGPFHIDGDVLTIPGSRGTGESRLKRY
jgi:hypothetical protein